MLNWRNSPLYDETQRLVIEYAEAVTRDARAVGEGLFERLRSAFSDEQIVELTFIIGLWSLTNRFNQALHIEVEEAMERALAAMR